MYIYTYHNYLNCIKYMYRIVVLGNSQMQTNVKLQVQDKDIDWEAKLIRITTKGIQRTIFDQQISLVRGAIIFQDPPPSMFLQNIYILSCFTLKIVIFDDSFSCMTNKYRRKNNNKKKSCYKLLASDEFMLEMLKSRN